VRDRRTLFVRPQPSRSGRQKSGALAYSLAAVFLSISWVPACLADFVTQFPTQVAKGAAEVLKPGNLFISFVPDSAHAPGVFHVYRLKDLWVVEKGQVAQVKLSVIPLIGVIENVSPIDAHTACFDSNAVMSPDDYTTVDLDLQYTFVPTKSKDTYIWLAKEIYPEKKDRYVALELKLSKEAVLKIEECARKLAP
jgi:hypothetical protein